jgi:hypothetical protein
VVKKVQYAADRVFYSTFDKAGAEILRLNFVPRSITEGAMKLAKRDGDDGPGWTFDPALKAVRVRHVNTGDITIQ